MSKTKSRLRWFRFSIRGILLATLLTGTFMAGRLSLQLEMEQTHEKPAAVPAPIYQPLRMSILKNGKKWVPLRTRNIGDQTNAWNPFEETDEFFVPIKRVLTPSDWDFPLDETDENEIPDSIEQGMKASELDMQERFGFGRKNNRPRLQ